MSLGDRTVLDAVLDELARRGGELMTLIVQLWLNTIKDRQKPDKKQVERIKELATQINKICTEELP